MCFFHKFKKRDDKALTHERRITFVILILFDLSYILRFIYDRLYDKLYWEQEEYLFGWIISGIVGGFFFDYIPISLILFIHSRNMKVHVDRKSIQIDEEEEESVIYVNYLEHDTRQVA